MPNWNDLRRFLNKNGNFIRSGKHDIYSYQGRRIIISHGSGEIGPDLWRDILRKELRITQEEFYAGI